jgi:hypothetical protein
MSSSGQACAYEYEYETEPNVLQGWESQATEPQHHSTDPELRAEIIRAEKLIDDYRDSEDEDAVVYSRESFNRAKAFLKSQSEKFRKMCGSHAPVPNIGAGPDRSVDLHWKSADRELLVNIPHDIQAPGSYYGENNGINRIKGSFDPANFDYGIIMWLMSK